MFTQQKDYLSRMIQQLARALAALAGLKAEKRADEGASLIRQVSLELLGMEYDVLLRMDVESVAQLLSSRARLEALARLASEEATLLEGALPDDAAALRAKARAFESRALVLPGPALDG